MSGTNHPTYRRLIVELGHAGADPRTLQAAAEFARLLGLAMHGVFVEDESLHALAALPFAREIRLPTHEWTPLAADRLSDELHQAAEQARRAMQAVVVRLDVPNVFQVVRGDLVTCIGGLCSTTDILVVTQPAAAASATAVLRLQEAAQRMPASVLLLPANLQPRTGPVAAVLQGPADPALQAAARVAVAGHSDLLILLPAGPDHPNEAATDRAAALGVPRQRITARIIANPEADTVLEALGEPRERLVVAGRSAAGAGSVAGATRIAASHHVPVLVAEPPAAT